jgi:hypothetical protein
MSSATVLESIRPEKRLLLTHWIRMGASCSEAKTSQKSLSVDFLRGHVKVPINGNSKCPTPRPDLTRVGDPRCRDGGGNETDSIDRRRCPLKSGRECVDIANTYVERAAATAAPATSATWTTSGNEWWRGGGRASPASRVQTGTSAAPWPGPMSVGRAL